jgi:hypothetical protein
MVGGFDQRWQKVVTQVNIAVGPQPDPVCLPVRPISEWSWQELGIHRAVDTSGLPTYLTRPHDELIEVVLDPDVTASRLVVLRGDSSTGKSRALYRAVAAGRFASWRLARVSSAHGLRELMENSALAPQTIVWLGEMRDYTGQPDTPAAIARLAGILAARSGVIAVTTIWHDHWHQYTADYATPRPYLEVRDLLIGLPELDQLGHADPARGAVIDVPPYFTKGELELARRTGDPALTTAIRAAEDGGHGGQVLQYLAGVPRLRAHYQHAQHRVGGLYGKAVLTAAMDAARLADARETSAKFLEHAAWGYLSDEQRADAPGDWVGMALADATATLRGGLRALTPLQSGDQPKERRYRLSDILDQDGQRQRAEIIPPSAFFAAARHSSSVTARRLGQAAAQRGLLRTAAVLYRASAPSDVKAAELLALLMHDIDPADPRPVAWCWFRIVLNQGWMGAEFSRLLMKAGVSDQCAMLADRVDPSNTHAAASLIAALRKAGAWPQMITLADRALAYIDLSDCRTTESLLWNLRNTGPGRRLADCIAGHDDLGFVYGLVSALKSVGADRQAAVVADRIAAETDVTHPLGVGSLIKELAKCGFGAQSAALADRAAAQADPCDWEGVRHLLQALRDVSAWSSHDALADRLVDHSDLRGPLTGKLLLDTLDAAGSSKKHAVADCIVALADLSDPEAVVVLIKELGKQGFARQSAAVADRAAAQADPGDQAGVRHLLEAFREVNAWSSYDALADRAIVQTDPHDLQAVTGLLREIRLYRHRRFQFGRQAASAVSDAATDVDVADPLSAAAFIKEAAALIKEVGRWEPDFGRVPAALADRLATQADASNPRAMAALIEALHRAGVRHPVTCPGRPRRRICRPGRSGCPGVLGTRTAVCE